MSRPAVVALCAGVLVVGFVAGRVAESGPTRTLIVTQTVERAVVVSGRHLGSASDAKDTGPLDLMHVASVRQGSLLETTIVTRNGWHDSLLRHGRVRLRIDYDTNNDGKADRRDTVFLFRGRITSWISSFRQGVQAADVTRRSPTTITISRDTSVFYNHPGEGGLVLTSPIGVAVVARWKGGGDRLPDSGFITVLPPRP